MKRDRIFDIVAIISTMGMIMWLMTDFYGGMIIYLLSYGIFILPMIFLYLCSLLETLSSLIRTGFGSNKIKLLFHLSVIVFVIFLFIYHSEFIKSDKVLSAGMKDDLFYYTLIFRENGECEMDIIGMFGYQDNIKGNYYIKGDTIIFTKRPYDNDRFIPDTLLIDREEDAIFLYRDSLGYFDKKKQWLNYFNIIE